MPCFFACDNDHTQACRLQEKEGADAPGNISASASSLFSVNSFITFFLISGSGIFLRLIGIAVLIFAAVFRIAVFAVLRIHFTLIIFVCGIFAVSVF